MISKFRLKKILIHYKILAVRLATIQKHDYQAYWSEFGKMESILYTSDKSMWFE